MLTGEMKSLVLEYAPQLMGIEGSLISEARDKKVRTILVTSCSVQEGKTTTAVSMAYSLSSKTSTRVVLGDAHLQAPKLHEVFGIAQSPGLTELLASKAALWEATRKTERENLMIVTSGAPVPQMPGRLEEAALPDILGRVREQADYVIIDGGPIFGSSDALLMCRHVECVVLVVECERTRWEALQQAKEAVLNAGGHILGVVLNKRRYYIPKQIYGKI